MGFWGFSLFHLYAQWLHSGLQLAQLRDKSSGELQSPLPFAWRGVDVFYGI